MELFLAAVLAILLVLFILIDENPQ